MKNWYPKETKKKTTFSRIVEAAPFGTDLGIIYCAFNLINGKCYVGQTWVGIKERKKRHLERRKGSLGCRKFSNALNKYGEKTSIWIELDSTSSQEDLDSKENYWINKLDCIERGYNLKSGGLGGRHSEESNKKNRESNIKYWSSNEARIEHSKRHGARPFYAKKGDVMHRFETQFEAGKALNLHKGHIGQCLCGKRKTTGGWYFSYDDLSDFVTPNRFWAEKSGNLIEFFSANDAARKTGLKCKSSISRCLNGVYKQMKGWRFSYDKKELVS